ncbi:HtaA domain-containing protein [Nocardioides sp. GY 10127]|uniref:HtaA domain-containing protein n=1 Tax=Nocardioides sp. GY 10127 TaxID=2569762 RepID=UPI0014590694|nr:HtaA domain-containing protein [Nocardioides sp. GY 10127]
MSVPSPTPRRLAALTATAATGLAGLGLAAVVSAPSAGADEATVPTLTWGLSSYFTTSHLTATASGDATVTDGIATFPDGEGTVDPETGEAEVTYAGTVTGAFAYAGNTVYSVTFADPTLVVEADGSGEVTADVSWYVQGTTGDTARVTLTTFSGAAWTDEDEDGVDELTVTPDWEGVLEPGSDEATALGLTTNSSGTPVPVDGKSWSPELLAQLSSSVRALFYASGSSNDALKQPQAITATAEEAETAEAATPSVTAEVTTQNHGTVKVSVTGTGFTAGENAGDDGVYVGLAPSGGLPDTSSQESASAFAASAWIAGSALDDDGGFTTTLTADPADLDASTGWSVYTWRAHGHSDDSMDTVTEVSLDWKALGLKKAASTTTAAWKRTPAVGRAGRLRAVVKGAYTRPTGTVRVRVVKADGSRTVVRKVSVKKVAARRAAGVVTLPKLGKGRWTVAVRYLGSDYYRASTVSLTRAVR